MGLFDRFRKDRDDTVLPPEVDKYYREERSNHRIAALFLGLATFVITLVVGSLFFFGGRAIYRAVTDEDSNEQVAQPANQADNNDQSQNQNPGSEQNNGQGDQENVNLQGSANESGSSPLANNEPNRKRNPSSTATSVPLGDDTTLPATGDPGM